MTEPAFPYKARYCRRDGETITVLDAHFGTAFCVDACGNHFLVNVHHLVTPILTVEQAKEKAVKALGRAWNDGGIDPMMSFRDFARTTIDTLLADIKEAE